MTIRYRMTNEGTEKIAEDGTVTVIQGGTPDYDEFFEWLAEGGQPESAINEESLAELKARLSTEIDTKVADIYSNWTRFQQAYLNRESAAQAFKDAGYVGDPGVWVTGFAGPAGMTNQAAADLILSQATSLNGALAALDAQRMRKYEVLKAEDASAAQSAYDDIISKIDTIAAAIK